MENARGTVRTSAVATQATLVCAPNDRRVALLFSPPATAGTSYTISTEPGVTLGAGINLHTTSGPVTISAAVFGDAVHRSWYAVASAAMTVGYVETVIA
jgi:hypothetical protein